MEEDPKRIVETLELSINKYRGYEKDLRAISHCCLTTLTNSIQGFRKNSPLAQKEDKNETKITRNQNA